MTTPDQGIFFYNKERLKTILAYEFIGSAFVTTAFTISDSDSQARAFAYFIMYVVASHICGAHFNPATTIACFITDKQAGKHIQANGNDAYKQLGFVLLAQLLGSVAGILVTFILAKDYVTSYVLFPQGSLYTYFDVFTNEQGFNYLRIFLLEMLWTFFFTAIFLAIRG